MSGKFEPKTPVQLAPPKDDIISLEELSKADGMFSLAFFLTSVVLFLLHIGCDPSTR